MFEGPRGGCPIKRGAAIYRIRTRIRARLFATMRIDAVVASRPDVGFPRFGTERENFAAGTGLSGEIQNPGRDRSSPSACLGEAPGCVVVSH